MLPLLIVLGTVMLLGILFIVSLTISLFRDVNVPLWTAIVLGLPLLLGGGTYGYYTYTAQPIKQESIVLSRGIGAVNAHMVKVRELIQSAEMIDTPLWDTSRESLLKLGGGTQLEAVGDAQKLPYVLTVEPAGNGTFASSLYYNNKLVSHVAGIAESDSYVDTENGWVKDYPLVPFLAK